MYVCGRILCSGFSTWFLLISDWHIGFRAVGKLCLGEEALHVTGQPPPALL